MKKLVAFVFSFFVVAVAQAVEIQQINAKENISAYFVESSALPMVSVQVAFRAGDVFAPEGKEGLASITAAMLSQGAGDMDSEAFQQELQNIGARFGAKADDLNLTVSLTTLSKHKKRAFELMKEALLHPRFEQADFDRIQKAMVAGLKSSSQQPATLASQTFEKQYYGNHPYGRFATVKSVEGLTLNDVRAYYAAQFKQANMVVSVVGDMTAKDVKKALNYMLDDLPTGKARNVLTQIPPVPNAQRVRIEKAIPQTHVLMGHKGIDRHDADYFTAYAMNYILGGGGFNSRLMEEVREKRGLAYSVYSYFEPMPIYGRFMAAVQTKNKDAETSIALMKHEFGRMKAGDVTEEELANAKRYLIGSFPLRISSNAKILNYLTVMQMENLGMDYLDVWTQKIEAITLADIKRVASRLLNPDDLVIVTVGGVK